VRIEIVDYRDQFSALETKVAEKYNLMNVLIVPDEGCDSGELKDRLGRAAAKYLETLITDNMILGVSWGTTMQAVEKNLSAKYFENLTIVQLVGGMSRGQTETHASVIAMRIADKYHTTPFLLPIPAIVDNWELKKALTVDRNIRQSLERLQEAHVAIFSIGVFNQNSILHKARYFSPQEVVDLENQGAVADICSRVIDACGNICSPELNNRTIGVELEQLRNIPLAIAVAGGLEKLTAIRAGLRGRYFKILITDERVARELIRQNPKTRFQHTRQDKKQ
jgi:deoxyribonucleoside regulator